MTKRLRILALGMMIVVLLVAFTGCSEQLGSVKDAIMGVKDKVVSILTPYLPACEHEGGEASCTEQAVCVKCGESYGDVLGHDIVVDEAVEPDCENTGLTEGKHCSRCDYTSGAEVVDALGHNVVVDAAVPATCYSTGLTEGKHCDRCEEVIVAQTETTMIPHTYDEEGFDETCNAEGCTHVRTCAHDGEKTVVAGKAPTCTVPGLTDGETCAICGDVTKAQEVIDALGHDMAEATCTAPATCKRGCGYTVGTSKGHSYNDGVVTTAPTCTEKGVKTFTCSVCGDSYTEEVKANGHDYAVTVVPSTCIAQGYTNHDCKNCDDSYNDNYTALADHTYDAGVVTTAPTCTEDGEKTYTCTLEGCGHSYTEVVRTEGHATVSHEGKAATCTEDGYEAYVTCENCDYTTYKVITSTGHSGGKATCKSLAVCSACGETYGNYDTVNGHDYGEADCDSPATCKLCGKTSGEAIGHADDDKNHKCDRCDKEQGEHVDANSDHVCDYGCSEPIGVCEDANKDHVCDYGCGKEYGEHADSDRDHACDYGCSVTIGKHSDGTDLNHTCDYGCSEPVEGEVCVDGNKDHKCDECNGKMSDCADTDKDHLCDVCGVTLTECADKNNDHNCDVCGKKLTDCDDDNGDHYCDLCDEKVSECADTNRDHKCDLCGETVSVCADDDANHYCDVCGNKLTECTDGSDADHKCDVCGAENISEHSYTSEVTAPTCTEEGYTTYTCACGHSYTDDETPAAGHSWDNGVVTTPEGCETTGVKTYTCGTCGGTKTEDIDALGHNTEGTVAHKDATCTETGVVGGTYCTRCNEGKVAAEATISALGHNTEGTVAHKDATCTETGVVGGTYCTVCGNGKAAAEAAISALGHNTEGTVDHKDATCTEAGVVGGTYCTRCNEGKAAAEATIPAGGHKDANSDYKCDTCNTTVLPAADSVLTIEQAIAIAKALGPNNYTTNKYYITAVVVNIYNDTYGNANVIDKAGNTYVFYGLYDNNGVRYDEWTEKLAKGDEITIYGVVGSYKAEDSTSVSYQVKNGTADEIVKHTEHDCTYDVTDPTCTVDGFTTYTCWACGYSYTDNIVTAPGHTMVDGVCTVCGVEEGTRVIETWEKVMNTSDLKVGDIIVFVYEDGSIKYEMTSLSSNIGLYGKYTELPAGTMTFEVVAGASDGQLAFKNGSSYLAITSDENKIHTNTTVNANSSWTVTIENGKVVMINVAFTARYFQWNNTANQERFASYKNTQKPIGVYVKSTKIICAECDMVEIERSAATCTSEGYVKEECSKCHNVVRTVLPVLEHDWSNNDGVCAEGCGKTCGHTGVTPGDVCGTCGYQTEVGGPVLQEKTATLNIYANKGTVSGTTITWTNGNVQFKNEKASSGTAIRTSDTDHFRVYQGNKTTISAPNMTKVVITCTSSSYATALKNSLSAAGYSASVSSSTVTVTLDSVDSISFNASAQWRLKNIVVTYAE